MGVPFRSSIDSWASGVITSVEPDQVPPSASPRGRNATLVSAAASKAAVAKRRGARLAVDGTVTGATPVIGQFAYVQSDGTQIHVLVSDNGRIDRRNNDNTLTTIGATALTASAAPPAFAAANDLLFIANGTDRKKLRGTTVENFGITRPSAAPTLSVGAGTAMTGAYDVAIAYKNVHVTPNHMSSASDPATITLTASGLQVSWSAPTDPQITHVVVGLRKESLALNFYQVAEVAVGTTTTTVDVSDAAFNNLITLFPDTAENEPPAAGIRYLAWHRSRLFASDGKQLLYSKVGKPEAFDPDFVEPVNKDDGQPITGLYSDHDILIIFKRDSMYGLYGDDPNSWQVRLIDKHFGCVSHRSIVSFEGITAWWAESGPTIWAGAGPPQNIGQPLIRPTIGPDAINTTYLDHICADVDTFNEKVIFAVPSIGSSRNDILLPFNYRLQVWESTEWNPFDVASMATVQDGNSRPWIYLGNYGGRVFRWWDADNDGVPAGTRSGSFTASASSLSTITSTGFDTGQGLAELYVYIQDANGLNVQRRRIASNTSTTLTLVSALNGLVVGATYTWYIGAIDWEWDTKWEDDTEPFYKKRYEFVYVMAQSSQNPATLALDLAFDYDTSAGQTKSIAMSTAAVSALWDVGVWNAAAYGTRGIAPTRQRVGRTGRAWRLRVRHRVPDIPVVLFTVGMRGELLSDKS